jgi:hypothetical protein
MDKKQPSPEQSPIRLKIFNMKNILKLATSLTVIIIVLIAPVYAWAATKSTSSSSNTANTTLTPSANPTSESLEQKLNQQIENLKDKVASRVAQLNLVEKRGIIGTVTDSSNSQVTLNDLSGNTRYVDVDEITKFSSPSAKASFGISDLTKGTQVSVLGIYNKQSKRILARFIDVVTNPVFVSGVVSDIDKQNYVVTITTEENKQQKIDIETVTKIDTYDKDNGIIKYGFSKLQVGDRAFAAGYPEKANPSMLMGSRILVVPGLAKDPKIQIVEPSAAPSTDNITPSTGNGKKLTPIKK